MKLFDFTNQGPLNDLRIKMGASLVSDISLKAKVFDALTIEELEELTSGGLERFFSDCNVESDHTLSYKGKRVVVYIHDRHMYNDEWALPRFHIACCRTLDEQSKKDTYNQKYVISQRDDGLFSLRLFKNGAMENVFKKLDVCQNCLAILEWNNFSRKLSTQRKLEYVASFSMEEFFKKYPKDVLTTLPKYTSDTVPINDYPTDWDQIKQRLFAKRGRRCEGLDCGAKNVVLEVHHKNGIRSNNDDYNLEILCHSCHQKHHSHYK